MELIPPGTPFLELPEEIERRCCLGKITCGPVLLIRRGVADFDQETGEATTGYTYMRESNMDEYWPPQPSVDRLIELMNDPECLFSEEEQQEREERGWS